MNDNFSYFMFVEWENVFFFIEGGSSVTFSVSFLSTKQKEKE